MRALILLALFMGQILTGSYRRPTAAAVTVIDTAFNEGTVGAGISGTAPAVNLHGNFWTSWPTSNPLTFKSGGGAGNSAGAFQGDVIDTGATGYTVTFSGVTNTNNTFFGVSAAATNMNDRMGISLTGAGGITLTETTVAGGSTTVGTQALGAGATGSVVAVCHGTSITVTVMGNAPLTYTIPAGHANINGRIVGMFISTGTGTVSHMKVTVP